MRAWLKRQFVSPIVGHVADWATVVGLALGLLSWTGLMAWAASSIGFIAEQGWGAVLFAALGATCLMSFAARAALPVLIYLRPRETRSAPSSAVMTSPGSSPELDDDIFVKANIRAKPGGKDQDFVWIISVTATKNITNFAIIGRPAICMHYLSKAEWKWQPSSRLFEAARAIAGEAWEFEIFRRPRVGENFLRFFSAQQIDDVKELLTLTRIEISGDGFSPLIIMEPFYFKTIGDSRLLEWQSLDKLSYIEGTSPS